MNTKRTYWILDLEHSSIRFSIRHLVISEITGHFRIFSGKLISTNEDFTDSDFNFTIDVYSIDTNSVERDEHLKSEDFFSVDKYPEITFKSDSFTHIKGDDYKLSGNINLKGIIKPIVLDVKFGGQAKDGFGIDRAGFEITGILNRNDFNIDTNDKIESGGLILGENIKMYADIQFIKKEVD